VVHSLITGDQRVIASRGEDVHLRVGGDFRKEAENRRRHDQVTNGVVANYQRTSQFGGP
jgi:hypothetical protein